MAIGTGTAILAGTALSAGASFLGGNKAADAQVAGTQASIQAQREALAQNRELFDIQRADFEPWRQAGGNALAALEFELGLGRRPQRTERRSDYDIRRVKRDGNDGGGGNRGDGGNGSNRGGGQGGGNALGRIRVDDPFVLRRERERLAAQGFDVADDGTVTRRSAGDSSRISAGLSPSGGGNGGSGGGGGGSRFAVGNRKFDTRQEAKDFIDSKVKAPGNFNYRGFEATPGYEFRLGEGLDAIDASASARGGLFSGATMKAAQRYGEGLAAEEYGNYLARLGSMAGLGMDATGSQASLTGGLAGLEASAARGIGAASIAGGNARASGYANMANTFNSGIQNALGGLAYGGYLNG